MHHLFSAFKRHYRKAKDAFRAMSKTGNFGFNAHYLQAAGIQSTVDTPDSELTIRFVVLMRRFLAPADPLFIRVVWQLLEDEFGNDIPPEAREAYKQLESELNNSSGIKIVHNGEELTPDKIYHLLSEGEYFNREEQVRDYLASIAQVPIMGPLFWFQFYTYSVGGLELASLVFDVIRRIEQTDAFATKYGEQDESTHKCIFCLQTEGQFKSEEHIIPESLANTDWILPRGYVCDTCNNGILAILDNVLANSPLFTYMRVQYLPYDKRGRLPEGRLGATTIRRTGPLSILMRADPGSDAIKIDETLEDGWARFSLHDTIPQPFDVRLLARALCKVAIEMVAAIHGQEYTCGERFHAVRAFIADGRDFHTNFMMRTEFTPEPRINLMLPPVAKGTLAEIHIYGMVFLLSLEEQPEFSLNDALKGMGFIEFPLHGDASEQEFEIRMIPDPTSLERVPEQYRPPQQEPSSHLTDESDSSEQPDTQGDRGTPHAGRDHPAEPE